MQRITLRHSVFIERRRDEVWDFTQNLSMRKKWDHSVLYASSFEMDDGRTVRLRLRGGTTMTLVCKLSDRPNRTAVASSMVRSPFIILSNSSWMYEEQQGGTLWSQTKTVVLKPNILVHLIKPLISILFQRQMEATMKTAKKMMEHAEPQITEVNSLSSGFSIQKRCAASDLKPSSI